MSTPKRLSVRYTCLIVRFPILRLSAGYRLVVSCPAVVLVFVVVPLVVASLSVQLFCQMFSRRLRSVWNSGERLGTCTDAGHIWI